MNFFKEKILAALEKAKGKTKKIAFALAGLSLIFSAAAIAAVPKTANADMVACLGGLGIGLGGGIGGVAGGAALTVPVTDVGNASTHITNSTSNTGSMIKNCIINPLVKMMAQTLIRQFTASTVRWIQGGFHGSPAFIDNPEGFFGDIGDQVAGQFIQSLGPIGSMLCSPFDLQIRLSLGFSYTTKQYIGCRLSDIQKNINRFVGQADFIGGGGWKNWIQVSNVASNNPYGSYLQAQENMYIGISGATNIKLLESNWSGGFLSWRDCEQYAQKIVGYQGGQATGQIDYQTGSAEGAPIYGNDTSNCLKRGPIKTPGKVIESQLEQTLPTELHNLGLADSIDQIISALIGQGISQVFSAAGLSGGGRSNYGNGTSVASALAPYTTGTVYANPIDQTLAAEQQLNMCVNFVPANYDLSAAPAANGTLAKKTALAPDITLAEYNQCNICSQLNPNKTYSVSGNAVMEYFPTTMTTTQFTTCKNGSTAICPVILKLPNGQDGPSFSVDKNNLFLESSNQVSYMGPAQYFDASQQPHPWTPNQYWVCQAQQQANQFNTTVANSYGKAVTAVGGATAVGGGVNMTTGNPLAQKYPDGNIALNKSARQSSTFTGWPSDTSAGNATDGNTKGTEYYGLTLTNPATATSWWRVDLADNSLGKNSWQVSSVKIYGSPIGQGVFSKGSNFYVYITSSDSSNPYSDFYGEPVGKNNIVYESNALQTDYAKGDYTYTLNIPSVPRGRYVWVLLNPAANDFICLAEVQVFSPETANGASGGLTNDNSNNQPAITIKGDASGSTSYTTNPLNNGTVDPNLKNTSTGIERLILNSSQAGGTVSLMMKLYKKSDNSPVDLATVISKIDARTGDSCENSCATFYSDINPPKTIFGQGLEAATGQMTQYNFPQAVALNAQNAKFIAYQLYKTASAPAGSYKLSISDSADAANKSLYDIYFVVNP